MNICENNTAKGITTCYMRISPFAPLFSVPKYLSPARPKSVPMKYCFQSLTHYQTTNFRLFQTEGVCRRQFQIGRKWQKVIQTGRKLSGKRRNCSLQAVSPFPKVCSKGLFPRGVKRCHCVGMG